MKKLGLICLALVVALGALGTGYAMWYDTVTISGEVQTGSVDIVIENVSFDRVYKCLETDELVYEHHVVEPGQVAPDYRDPAQFLLVGETTAVDNGDDSVTISYNNIFPIPGDGWLGGGYWLTDFGLHGMGSVPVKLEVDVDIVGIPEEWVVVGSDSFGVPAPVGVPLEGIQLEYCDWISCFIAVCVPDGPDNPNVGMNMNGTITVTVKGVQWNEYTPPPAPSPTP